MKGVLKKLLVCGLVLVASLGLIGCSKEKCKVSFRVEDGYIQVTEDGTNWKNLIDVDDLKGEPGQNGTGVDGREVEFRSTETHIQWRYKTTDNSDAWKDLVAFEDLEQKEPVVDVDALNQRGFELFSSKLNDMNSDYKVVYDYADKYIVESFGSYGIVEYVDATSAQNLVIRVALEYDYSGKDKPIDSEEWYKTYTLVGIAEKVGDWEPTRHLIHSFTYKQDTEDYYYFVRGGGDDYFDEPSADKNFNFNHVECLKGFTADDIIDCQFNDNGDCTISFNYYGGNTYSSGRPYLKSDYTYKFEVTKDGEIKRCYVYEKDFLNPELKGDVYCKISYEKGKSLITYEMLNDLLEKEKEKNPAITCWVDYFAFTKSE